MAKERSYTPHQKGLIKRYYENKDHLMTQKLGEIVSDLYLCTDTKKAGRLWKSAETALINLGVIKELAEDICACRDLAALAKEVEKIF
ncbi:MAG: hypothetical protein ABIK28_21170 [Planctomycetota bacterium]